MYSLVLYQLSGIQAGIQAGHSWVEGKNHGIDKDLYDEWSLNHKTVMVMNGGSSSMLMQHMLNLEELGFKIVYFREPDLYNQIVSFSFIASSDDFNSDESGVYTPAGLYLSKLQFHGGR